MSGCAQMRCKEVKFSGHALKRMFERSIPLQVVLDVTASGDIISEYPDDRPLPSFLLMGYYREHPVHAVVAWDASAGICWVITVYYPDPDIWDEQFKRRK